MERIEVEVYSDATNLAVLRFPGREFPGSLIQGDTLSGLLGLASSIRSRAAKTPDTELREESEELVCRLEERLRVYEDALARHGIRLPY